MSAENQRDLSWQCANDVHGSMLIMESLFMAVLQSVEEWDYDSTDEMLLAVHDEMQRIVLVALGICGKARRDLERRGIEMPERILA